MADYKTVKGEATGTIYEKKSEFIGYIAHAKTEAEAQEFLAKIRKKHYDARHHCYAYIIKDEGIIRQSDDGEPSKTAGMPILEVLRHSGLEDAIIVVTRYFGGTLLGTGGLVRAYTEGAKAALNAAEILTYKTCVDLNITVDYSLYDKITTLCQNKNGKIIDTQFTDNVNITIRMLNGTQDELIKDLVVLTKGKEPTVSDELFDIF
ncbi:MAG: YigZ family protein [Oscillospiraceae bacterium]|nr:YigZ family protein [Oscillospiraceae bacterium]MBQ5325548.1 YigZ family protein [Oscillospiraceae bacterium]